MNRDTVKQCTVCIVNNLVS